LVDKAETHKKPFSDSIGGDKEDLMTAKRAESDLMRKSTQTNDKEKQRREAIKKLGKKLVGILSFLYYNNITFKMVTDNPQLFQKSSFTLPRI
jgi:hypothetical protein